MAIGKEDIEIVKPLTDNREYRRIVLHNSLQVLIISDPETEKVTSNLSESCFSLEVGNLVSVFKYTSLLCFFWQCAAAMNVAVGAFCDPDGLEGLAHFLGIFFLTGEVSYVFFFP